MEFYLRVFKGIGIIKRLFKVNKVLKGYSCVFICKIYNISYDCW